MGLKVVKAHHRSCPPRILTYLAAVVCMLGVPDSASSAITIDSQAVHHDRLIRVNIDVALMIPDAWNPYCDAQSV